MRRWLVLLAFSLNSAFNAFMFMDFAPVSEVSKQLFHIDNLQLNWIYSAGLLTVLPLVFPAAYLLETHDYATTALGVVMNCVGAWLRYLAVMEEDYTVAVLSSVPVGAMMALVVCTPTHLGDSWFPPHEKTLAISLAFQANYAGWCLGGAVVPSVVETSSDLKSLMFVQAMASWVVLGAFVFFHQDSRHASKRAAVEDNADRDERSALGPASPSRPTSLLASARVLGANRRFVVQGLCFAVLGGISWTVPAIQDQVFHDQGFSEDSNAWTNLAFIFSGVVCGVALGFAVSRRHHRPVLVALFVLCSVALSVLTYFSYNHDAVEREWLFVVNLLSMAVAGACSLGFIGVALAEAVAVASPVSETYSGGLVVWVLQVVAVGLTQTPFGFSLCCIVCWLATAVLAWEYRSPPPHIE